MKPSAKTRASRVFGMLLLPILCCEMGIVTADPPAIQDAQQSDAGTPWVGTLQTIVVTGTHIRDADLATEHPVQVITKRDIQRTGLTGLADIVQSLVVANGQTMNRNINNGGTGELTANLRSLGSNRTLVLVNGHRWAADVDGAVDLSAIPLALVERIEVLKDGASAIYGSDAIGGVINIITRRDYVGTEAGIYAGQTDHGDGRRVEGDFSLGRSGEKWNMSFGMQYSKDNPVFAGARQISSVPVPGLPLGATGSGFSQYGVFVLPVPPPDDFDPFVLTKGRPGTSPGDFHILDPATDFNYDFVPWNYLQTPQQRRATFGQFRWEFSPALAFSVDALFNQRRSAQQLAPPAVEFGDLTFQAGSPQSFEVSPQNLYNPFGTPVFLVATRWPDSEPRRFQQSVDTTHLHIGLDGSFELWSRDWNWTVNATQTLSLQSEFAGPYADNARLELAVGPSFRDAQGVAHCGASNNVIAGCVPLDLFTGPGRFTQAMLDFVDLTVRNYKRARSDSFDLGVNSTFADLPAGPLDFAAGLERRLERGADEPDVLVATGEANGTGETYGPTTGAYAVNEAYVELNVPLLRNVALARQLGVDLATRYSDYTSFGGTENSKLGVRWKPVDDLLVRATWSQGFRAPSIFEAFGGTVDGTGEDVDDICATQGRLSPPATIAANCAAHGVPAHPADFFDTITANGSNPALLPETSRSLTTGFVYSPRWFSGLDLNVDGYRIEIRNAIGNPGAQYFVDACYEQDDPTACSHITRGADGDLQHVLAINENIPGGIEAEGVDFGLSLARATRVGDIKLHWENAYVGYWGAVGKPPYGAVLPDGSLSQGNVAGSNNALYGVIWRLRSVATLAWQRGAWNASITGRYFSPVKEDCSAVTQAADAVGDPSLYSLCTDPNRMVDGVPAPRNRVGAVTYVDLEGGWHAPWNGVFTMGVRNAFDRNPPVAYSYADMNSFFPDYDIPGRFFYARYQQDL
ncbi:MAG TPA: TonB-dependent receptor [Rhodanobacteraceae bacterium]